MNENKKIQEAEYFLSLMFEKNERVFFTYNLSAFLTAARSVLQYALKESETKPNGKSWYDSAIQSRPVVKFFKDKRDINIHAEPINPSAEINIGMNDTISLSDEVFITLTDKDGNIVDERKVPPSQPTRKIESSQPIVNFRFVFRDWRGNEDVVDLSQQYIQELKDIINDGVARGFITG